MPTPAQTAAAATAVGGGALGGYALSRGLSGGSNKTNEATTQQISTISKPQKDPQTVEDGDLTASQYTLLTFTKQNHLSHLIKPLVATNEEWWKWAYESKYKKHTESNTVHDLFIGLNLPFLAALDSSKPEQKALNQACESAYKKAKTDYVFEGSYLLKNISDFCTKEDITFDISEPKSVLHTTHKTGEGYEYGVLGVSTNVNKLVIKDSDANNNNELWWTWSFKKLFTDEAKKNASEHFKKASSAFNASTQTALNLVCDSAYKKPFVTLNNDSKKLFNDIKKFCTPGNSSDESLNFPTGEPATNDYLGSATDFSSTFNSSSFAKENDNKAKLIDPLKSETWWKWMYANYYPADDTTLKNKYTDPFDKVTKAFGSETTSLNNTCKAAYLKDKNAIEKKEGEKIILLELIQKFCVSEKHRTQKLKNP